jgi:hypothetical protein
MIRACFPTQERTRGKSLLGLASSLVPEKIMPEIDLHLLFLLSRIHFATSLASGATHPEHADSK